MSDHDTEPAAPVPEADSVTSGGLADIYNAMAVVVENDVPTTFTDDRLFEATTRLADALTTKLVAARHIRGTRSG